MRDFVAPGLGLAQAAPKRDENRGFLGSTRHHPVRSVVVVLVLVFIGVAPVH